MTTKRITSGWRGLSIAKETAYGTAATVDTAFNFEGAPTDVELNEAQTDLEEVTGSNEAIKHEILNWMPLAGAMYELGQVPGWSEFVESYLMNSSKPVVVFPPKVAVGAGTSERAAARV